MAMCMDNDLPVYVINLARRLFAQGGDRRAGRHVHFGLGGCGGRGCVVPLAALFFLSARALIQYVEETLESGPTYTT